MSSGADPYVTLGVTADTDDEELRRAYRRLVKLHHPDHNGGSAVAARRFAAVQTAYEQVLRMRSPAPAAPPPPAPAHPAPAAAGGHAGDGDAIDARIAAMEREIARTKAARRAYGRPPAATPEELGIYDPEDSLSAIIDDAVEQAAERWHDGDAKRRFTQRLTELFGE